MFRTLCSTAIWIVISDMTLTLEVSTTGPMSFLLYFFCRLPMALVYTKISTIISNVTLIRSNR